MLIEGISIIICCYNSEWIIGRCLSALKAQVFDKLIHWEIVIVDNHCSDDTVSIANAILQESGVDYSIIEEIMPGLSFARHKGVSAAKYNKVIFCDDDNILCPFYVAKMYEILNSNSKIGAVGGKGIPEFCGTPDSIVLSNIENYAIGSQKNHEYWLYGAGIALRTELVREIYSSQHCYLTGRKGNMLLAGDDVELSMAIALRGYKIKAVDQLTFVHVLKAERLTQNYYYSMIDGFILVEPVILTMQSVLFERHFFSVLKAYLCYCYRFFMNIVLMRYSENISIRKRLSAFHFWGLPQLLRIHKEWTNIKKNYPIL